MKPILLVAILLFVLAGVHSISTGRNRVEREAPTEAGEEDNEPDDDDNDDDDDEDPPEPSDTLHDGHQDPQQVTNVNKNIWTNKRFDSEKTTNEATNIQNKPGPNTKPAVTAAQTHWSRNRNHHKTHRQTHRQAHHQHHQRHRQTKHQARHHTHHPNQRHATHKNHRQTQHRNHRQTQHNQNYRQAQRQIHRQTHRQASRHTNRQVHRQNHYKSHMHPTTKSHSHYQTQHRSPSTSKSEKVSGNFAHRKTFRKQPSNSNIDLGRKFRTVNSLKINTAKNTKQTQGTVNHKTTNRHRNHNIRKTTAKGKHQSTHRQQNFNWGNRGLNIRQPQQTFTPVTQKPTLAPSVSRSLDHVTRQVSPQPTYTTPSPPVHRQNQKSSVVNNRWNRNRFVNSNHNTAPSQTTSKEVKQTFSKTIMKYTNSENNAQLKPTHTSAKSPRWQQPNNRFNNNQRKANIQNRNYWHNQRQWQQRQQQSTSGGFVPQQHRPYKNNIAKISPVGDIRATQYPVRKEFMASSVKQSRTPDNVAIHSPAVLSSPNSNTANSPSAQLSDVIYPHHVSNIQRNTQGPRNVKLGENRWNGLSNTGVTWSGTLNSGSSANNKNKMANSRNIPSLSVPSPSSSASNGWLKQHTKMDSPNSPKLLSHTNQKPGHQVDKTTQSVPKTIINKQTKAKMLTGSSVDSLTSPSVSSGSSMNNEWASQSKYHDRVPTVKSHIGWTSDSGSINQQGISQPASTMSSSSSPNSITSNAWSSTRDNKRQHQPKQGREQQQQQQNMQLQSSADKHTWMPTSVLAVQETPTVVQSVITPTVALESEPSGQMPLESISDNRNHQHSAVSSSAKTSVAVSSSASAASYVPTKMFDTPLVNNAKASSINHDIPIPSFEAMGLTAPNNIEPSSISQASIPSQNQHTNSPNTVPNTLARHLIRESVTEHYTQTKIEEQPKQKKETVNENAATRRGSALDQNSLYRLTTKKPLFIGIDSKSINQRQIPVSQTTDSPKQAIAQGVDKVSRATAKSSNDIGLYAPTLTINEAETRKPTEEKQPGVISASDSPSPPDSFKQQSQITQEMKPIGGTKGTSSPTNNDSKNKGTEQIQKQTVVAASVDSIYNDRIGDITRHSIDTSSRTPSTDVSGRKSPSISTSQSAASRKHHQSNTFSGISSLSHPKTVNNNLPNFETAYPISNKISTAWAVSSFNERQGQQSGQISVNKQNRNIVSSLSQPQGKSSGILSKTDKNKVNHSFSKANSEKSNTMRSDVTGTKDNTALLSQQSTVLHQNIDVIQSGTRSINQGGASLSMLTGDVNKGDTNTVSVTEAETRQSLNTVYKSPAVTRKQQSGNRVVEPYQEVPEKLKQTILQPLSFIDSVNKEMAALSAQNAIPVVNQVRKDQVFVSRGNEWDRVVPSIPDILASMGRPKLSFGVDPGHTVKAIKRVPSKAKESEVTPEYNTKQREAKQFGPSVLDVALGRTRIKNTSEANKKSEMAEKSTKPDIPFTEYNTFERRQSQADPIKEVQVIYNQLGGTLPIVGEAPFNVGLPGDQVYSPTSSRRHHQSVKESVAAGPKRLTPDSLLEGTTESPLSSNVLYHGPLDKGKMDKTSVNSKLKESNGLQSRSTNHNKNTGTNSVIKIDKTQKNTNLADAKPVQKDTTFVSNYALSSPVKATTRSIGPVPSTTVATTDVPAFSTRRITTSHNVLLERLFDYNALVTTTPSPINRNGKVVYTQMQNGPFTERQKFTHPEKDARPTPLNRNSVVDYTQIIAKSTKEKNKISNSVKGKWQPGFSLNANNVLVSSGTRPKTVGSMNSFTTASNSHSLVSFANTQGSSLVSSSHNEVRKVDVPGWNADYSVANSLSGFGEIDLKTQSHTNTSTSTSPAGNSTNHNKAVSAVKDTTVKDSSNKATVEPIVSGKIEKSLTEQVVTGDTGRLNTNNGNIPLRPYEATNEAPAMSSLISPPEVNIISADSSSVSLMAHNEYGIETTTKTSVEQPKSAEKPETLGSKQTAGKGTIDRKTDNFQSAGANPNEFFPGRMKFQRQHGMGFYSMQGDSKRKQNNNISGKINNNVETSFTSVRPDTYVSRPPPPFHSRGMTSRPFSGRIRGKYNFMTG